MPACGNCVNRGEITACCYVARKAESRTKSQESSVPADAGQDRIDRLEQLVFTLLKNGQHSQRQVNTPSSGIDVDHDTISDNIFVETSDQEHLGVSGVHDKRATDSLAGSNTVITIGADFKQPASDEAHWALLLNEVCDIGVSTFRPDNLGRLAKFGRICVRSKDNTRSRQRRWPSSSTAPRTTLVQHCCLAPGGT